MTQHWLVPLTVEFIAEHFSISSLHRKVPPQAVNGAGTMFWRGWGKRNSPFISLISFQRKNGFWALNTLALYGALRGRECSQATHLDLNDFNKCVKSREDIRLASTQLSLDNSRALTLSGFLWLLWLWNKKKLNWERVVQQHYVTLILLGISELCKTLAKHFLN